MAGNGPLTAMIATTARIAAHPPTARRSGPPAAGRRVTQRYLMVWGMSRLGPAQLHVHIDTETPSSSALEEGSTGALQVATARSHPRPTGRQSGPGEAAPAAVGAGQRRANAQAIATSTTKITAQRRPLGSTRSPPATSPGGAAPIASNAPPISPLIPPPTDPPRPSIRGPPAGPWLPRCAVRRRGPSHRGR